MRNVFIEILSSGALFRRRDLFQHLVRKNDVMVFVDFRKGFELSFVVLSCLFSGQ